MSQIPFKLALLCGGPSLERGISMNSARSVMDHLQSECLEIHPFYVDHNLNFYVISPAQLYSNTPSDFDFKLAHTATPLKESEFIQQLKECDLVFPAIHGQFGEDGDLQQLLEQHAIPFVGSSAKACRKMFHKHQAAQNLAQAGFDTLDSLLLHRDDPQHTQRITEFFTQHQLQRAIVKPVAGGSSIGVFSVTSIAEAVDKAQQLFTLNMSDEALIEPFCKGREFTIIVLQNPQQQPVALIPTQIQVSYEQGGLFDYRRKYLPTSNTRWLCPPQFSDNVIQSIQQQAEQLFALFGMSDCARLDGWLLDDGKIVFTDFNPLSGMEQNSFIFQQASRLGLTHNKLLNYVVSNACRRYHINLPRPHSSQNQSRKSVYVLFGGKTAERQVSLMSGTNVWLKLRHSKNYIPEPYFLDVKGQVWHLPYTYALNHTVEEIYENCLTAPSTVNRLQHWVMPIRERLGLRQNYDPTAQVPQEMSFMQFMQQAQAHDAFVFIALHGGEGEDGQLQQHLQENGLTYNGSNAAVSSLCMDKQVTGLAVAAMGNDMILTAAKKSVSLTQLASLSNAEIANLWQSLCADWRVNSLIIKPQSDGCSAGIAQLHQADDLAQFVKFAREGHAYLPPHTLSQQLRLIEMPPHQGVNYLLEAYIATDDVHIEQQQLCYQEQTGWLEMTIGVLEQQGQYHAFNPSITVAEHDVLSLEEKFQGGTGVNITPPPESIVSPAMLQGIKQNVEQVAAALGIQNYARLDLFFNILSGQTIIIEANSLPALTPATVLYHQALAETPPLNPTQFLSQLIRTKIS